MRSLASFAIFMISLLLFSCRAPTVSDAIGKTAEDLKIQHVFSRPSRAYGPGSIVFYDKEQGYTGVCLPRWIIGRTVPKKNAIAATSSSQQSKYNFSMTLSAADRAKLGAKLEGTTDISVKLENGYQYEVLVDWATVESRIMKGPCKSNILRKLRLYPKGKIIFIQSVYGFDFSVEVMTSQKTKLSAKASAEVLKAVAPELSAGDFTVTKSSLVGKNLFIGFNGDPITSADLQVKMNANPGEPTYVPEKKFVDLTSLVESAKENPGDEKEPVKEEPDAE